MKWPNVVLATGLAFGLNGCFTAKKKVKVVIPVAMPSPPPVPTAPALPEPTTAVTEAPVTKPPEPEPKPVPPPPVRQRPPRRTQAQTTTTPPPVTPPKAVPAPEQAPVPRLGEILTDDRRRELEGDFTRNITQARAALGQTQGKTLTAANRQTVDRIRTFLQQADESRNRDLVTALQFARRAALLAQDLLQSLP